MNTANNFFTSYRIGKWERVQSDFGINAAKIVTGTLGMSFGIVGGDTLGAVYGNGMDAYLNGQIK